MNQSQQEEIDHKKLVWKLKLTKNFKEFMGKVNLGEGNPMISYYSKLFDKILDDQIIDYSERGKAKIEYTFEHHFRMILENKVEV